MKKKLFLCMLFLFTTVFCIFSIDWATIGGWHRYTDYQKGYSGIAKSYYIGKTSKINSNSFSSYLKDYIQNEGVYKINSVHDKLSKAEKFILLCELDNWDLENGDVYVVRIITGVDVQVVIASVDGNGRVTNWYCYDCF